MSAITTPVTWDVAVALCTPRGAGAIALIRASGAGVFELVGRYAQLSGKNLLASVATHTIHHGYLVSDSGERIDEVLFLVMHAPRTFTGEDTVEITCHNNPFIIDRILQTLLASGAVAAGPGEFSRRAVMHGKMDLTRAEAIHELIAAQTEQALKRALEQLSGSLAAYCKNLHDRLVELISYCEASFEFLDEEQRDIDFNALVRERLESFVTELKKVSVDFSQQKRIREGVRIAFIGSVNAGKSTLFNNVVGKKRAIVSPLAGTTRDSVEAQIIVEGSFWTLIDTAGIRKTGDVIESEGIERSYAEAAQADIVLMIIDTSRVLSPEEQEIYASLVSQYAEKIIVVGTKSDLSVVADLTFLGLQQIVSVSEKNRESVAELQVVLREKVLKLFTAQNSPFLLNERQYLITQNLLVTSQHLVEQCRSSLEYELILVTLYVMLESLGEMTGRDAREEVMDNVFRSFCVGK